MVLDLDTEIEILLFDQERIVTYKEINNRFDITPKEAQSVLKKFITDRKSSSQARKGEISVVYLVILENKDNKTKKVQLANENDLKKIEDEFNIISKQIYSIQLKPISDFNLIYSNDVDASNNINRKSNLNVVFCPNEPQQENQMDTTPSTNTQEEKTAKQQNKTISEPSNVLRPSKESNVEKAKPTTDSAKEKDQPKESKVKEEPLEKSDSNVVKKIKLESEPSVQSATSKVSEKPAPAKPHAKQATGKNAPSKPANQSTLTSFFKKA